MTRMSRDYHRSFFWNWLKWFVNCQLSIVNCPYCKLNFHAISFTLPGIA